jgi:hypothetical protein
MLFVFEQIGWDIYLPVLETRNSLRGTNTCVWSYMYKYIFFRFGNDVIYGVVGYKHMMIAARRVLRVDRGREAKIQCQIT